MENTQNSLYEMLEYCTCVLANNVEEAYERASGNYNYEKIDAMSDWKREREYKELMKYTYFENLENQTEYEKIKAENENETLEACWGLMSDELREEIDNAMWESGFPDIYQTFIITKDTQDILKDYGEITWYNEDLDLYFWGVTHYGTHWSHIMSSQYPIN